MEVDTSAKIRSRGVTNDVLENFELEFPGINVQYVFENCIDDQDDKDYELKKMIRERQMVQEADDLRNKKDVDVEDRDQNERVRQEEDYKLEIMELKEFCSADYYQSQENESLSSEDDQSKSHSKSRSRSRSKSRLKKKNMERVAVSEESDCSRRVYDLNPQLRQYSELVTTLIIMDDSTPMDSIKKPDMREIKKKFYPDGRNKPKKVEKHRKELSAKQPLNNILKPLNPANPMGFQSSGLRRNKINLQTKPLGQNMDLEEEKELERKGSKLSNAIMEEKEKRLDMSDED